MTNFYSALLLCCFQLLFSCEKNTETTKPKVSLAKPVALISETPEEPELIPFTRDSIVEHLQNKIASGKPLMVHIFIPLCDNDHQNIVPVSKTLGDGQNLKTNLYWGAAYGVKTYFKNNGWKIDREITGLNDTILERIIFTRTLENGSRILAIADAYSGDKMEVCLNDFFSRISGEQNELVLLKDSTAIDLNETDLFAFTGHDGLMDISPSIIINKNVTHKDAVVLACVSSDFFNLRLNAVNAYPLITTKSLMAPEAYVLHATLLAWAQMMSQKEILEKACGAYAQYQKCSLSAAHTVFKTGW